TAAQAARALHRLERDAEKGEVSAGRLTVGQVFDRYLSEHLRARGAPTTYVQYKVALTVHATRLRALQAGKLALHHLAAYEAYLRTEAVPRRGGRPGKGRLSAVSVERYMVPVRSALEWAEAVELVARNPARHWHATTAHPEEKASLSRDEAATFLTALERSPWRPHLLTLLVTGMRLSELRGWRWSDVDLDGTSDEVGRYRIQQQWQWIDTRWIRRAVPKSRAGQRSGGLPGAVVAVLLRHRTSQKAAKLAAGKAWRDPEGGALVFADTANGGPFNATALRNHLYRLLRTAGLPRVTIHQLRHSWASLHIEAGTPLHEVSKLAGHTSERVTFGTYTHLDKGAGPRAAERLWSFLTGENGR
ncbi:MAG TPA: site-specific integrase, partial [Chloroflexota bacterium]|nr:site-specific integrase [Chloroflexota bacterium]